MLELYKSSVNLSYPHPLSSLPSSPRGSGMVFFPPLSFYLSEVGQSSPPPLNSPVIRHGKLRFFPLPAPSTFADRELPNSPQNGKKEFSILKLHPMLLSQQQRYVRRFKLKSFLLFAMRGENLHLRMLPLYLFNSYVYA